MARQGTREGENRPSLDLHGVAPDRVEAHLEQFLHQARLGRKRQVLIITGRGASNRTGEPLLRKKVETWLKANKERIGLVQRQVTNQGGALLLDLSSASASS